MFKIKHLESKVINYHCQKEIIDRISTECYFHNTQYERE